MKDNQSLKKGEVVRLTDMDGKQAIYLLCESKEENGKITLELKLVKS